MKCRCHISPYNLLQKTDVESESLFSQQLERERTPILSGFPEATEVTREAGLTNIHKVSQMFTSSQQKLSWQISAIKTKKLEFNISLIRSWIIKQFYKLIS